MEKYGRFYDFANIMKVMCTFVAIFYVFYWFLCLTNIPFLEYIIALFSPPVSLIKMFIKVEIPYSGTLIDMVPLIVSVIFSGLHFVFQALSKDRKSVV